MRRFLAYLGPGYLISVGYMDPGNWATDLSGGSVYGYRLLWVILLSSLMAMFLQTLCVRLGVAMGRDLAQACRDCYPKPVSLVLWVLGEIAIVACDLAEVIGAAVALKLLFNLPLVWGVVITGVDVLVLLLLTNFGFRMLEVVVIGLVAVIMGAFFINVGLSQPDWGQAAKGLVTPSLPDKDALFAAIGILGATVMPHNLYLHTSLVQTRDFEDSSEGRRQAIRLGTVDVNIALTVAFFVNAFILILSAAVFNRAGQTVNEIDEAHKLLTPLLGSSAASLFAVALLCSGQSSTITGTLAGQIVMEGFLGWRIAPWIRRLITRLLAIVPAVWLLLVSGGQGTTRLIEWSQIVLAMQLPFAIFPLVAFCASRKRMGEFAIPKWVQTMGYGIGAAITLANLWLLVQTPEVGLRGVLIGLSVCGAFGAWIRFGYKEIPEPQTPIEASKRHAASLSLGFNVVSTGFKLVVALMTGSVSMLSETMHSATDILSSGLAFLGVRAAAEPADDEHPFGHGKIESLTGFAEAILMGLTVLYVANESIHRLLGKPEVHQIDSALWLMCASAALAFAIGKYVSQVGKSAGSLGLQSNGQHLLVDCITSLGVLVALAIEKMSGWGYADPIVALLLAVWMAVSSWRLGSQAYQQLIDRRLTDREMEAVKAVLRAHPRVISFHRLRTRLSGNVRHVDVHIVVQNDLSLVASHAIADEVELAVQGALGTAEVTVHVDPFDPDIAEPV